MLMLVLEVVPVPRKYLSGPTSGCGVKRALSELEESNCKLLEGMLTDRLHFSNKDVARRFHSFDGEVSSVISVGIVGLHRRGNCSC